MVRLSIHLWCHWSLDWSLMVDPLSYFPFYIYIYILLKKKKKPHWFSKFNNKAGRHYKGNQRSIHFGKGITLYMSEQYLWESTWMLWCCRKSWPTIYRMTWHCRLSSRYLMSACPNSISGNPAGCCGAAESLDQQFTGWRDTAGSPLDTWCLHVRTVSLGIQPDVVVLQKVLTNNLQDGMTLQALISIPDVCMSEQYLWESTRMLWCCRKSWPTHGQDGVTLQALISIPDVCMSEQYLWESTRMLWCCRKSWPTHGQDGVTLQALISISDVCQSTAPAPGLSYHHDGFLPTPSHCHHQHRRLVACRLEHNTVLDIDRLVCVHQHMTVSTWQPAHDNQHMATSTWQSAHDNQHMTVSTWQPAHGNQHMTGEKQDSSENKTCPSHHCWHHCRSSAKWRWVKTLHCMDILGKIYIPALLGWL